MFYDICSFLYICIPLLSGFIWWLISHYVFSKVSLGEKYILFYYEVPREEQMKLKWKWMAPNPDLLKST